MPDLTPKQLQVLKAMREFPDGASVQEVGLKCDIDIPRAFGILRTLFRAGHVKPFISNGVHYSLTTSGLAVVEEGEKCVTTETYL